MTDEEFDLFIEDFKKQLEADSSKPANVCPCCGRVLSEAAAEHIQKSKEREAQLVS
jgi:hypothetical protein